LLNSAFCELRHGWYHIEQKQISVCGFCCIRKEFVAVLTSIR
jgi:hypothetical protein